MARLFQTYMVKTNPGGTNPKTLCQFIAPTNQRVVISSIELQPLGSTGASTPIEFDLCKQDDAGTSTDDTNNIVKNSPPASESPQLQVRKGFTVEPTTSTPQCTFTLHQQAKEPWQPRNPYREAIMQGGERWGIRVLSACSFNIGLSVQLEE